MSFLRLFLKNKTDKTSIYDVTVIKNTLIELLFFIIFLIIVSIISFDISGTGMFYMSSMIKKLLIERSSSVDNDAEISFEDICLIDDYWSYLNSIFIQNIYSKVQNDPTNGSYNENKMLILLSENILLGPPRLKQLRVRNNSCAIDHLFKRNFLECFGPYQHSIEDFSSFGLKNGTPWTYHTSNELQDMFLFGKLHIYSGGGFYLDLSLDLNSTETEIQMLQNNDWITRGTRLVVVEFSAYNINENILGIVKLIAEMPATGGIITSYSIKTLKLLTFVNNNDYFVMFCEIVFLIMICWYTITEILQLYSESWSYFKSIWNIIDVTILLISYCSFIFAIFRFKYIQSKFEEYKKNPHQYQSFDSLAFWQEQYSDCIAICVFLVWMKIFKYISFNKTMLQFCETLKRCAKDLLGFSFMFFVAFIAYAQLGYILFGTENEDFKTFRDSLFTLLRTILGDFDYLAIERANRILGPIFFITYVFIMFFVLLNMFLAIVNDTYSEVKNENVTSDAHIGSYIMNLWNQIVDRIAMVLPFLNKWRTKTLKKKSDKAIFDPELCNKSHENISLDRRSVLFEEIFNPVDDNSVAAMLTGLNDRIALLEDSIEQIVIKFDCLVDDLKKLKK